jgi:hypothetical protein
MAMGRSDQRLLAVAGVSAAIVVLSIVIGAIIGELPEVLWVFLVPIGMLGGAMACLVSLAIFLGRRAQRA